MQPTPDVYSGFIVFVCFFEGGGGGGGFSSVFFVFVVCWGGGGGGQARACLMNYTNSAFLKGQLVNLYIIGNKYE